MDKENIVFVYNGMFFSLKKGHAAICKNMDKHGGHNAKWKKLNTERWILHDITSLWNLNKKERKKSRMVVAKDFGGG